MRTTREELSRINAQLQEKIRLLENGDLHRKQKFTNLLCRWVESENSYMAYSQSNKEPKTFAWEEIFFKMGELNSDANYSILLEENRKLRDEIRVFQENEKKVDPL